MSFHFHRYTPFVKKVKTIPKPYGGYARACYMVIHTNYANDKGIFYHELRHVQHWWICTLFGALLSIIFMPNSDLQMLGVMFSSLIYMTLPFFFKYWAEIDCYTEQLKHIPQELRARRVTQFAEFISTKYNLPEKYSKKKALNDLIKVMNIKKGRLESTF